MSAIDQINRRAEADQIPPDIWLAQTLNRQSVPAAADALAISELELNLAALHLNIQWRNIAVPASAEVWIQPPYPDLMPTQCDVPPYAAPPPPPPDYYCHRHRVYHPNHFQCPSETPQ